ncbi:MAG: DNA primase [Alicyclobacillus sp.]|nr:DNA primase [Alicyclobacillus sp.]
MMSKTIDDATVAELLRRVDIVDVVSEYVQLRRAGRGYVGLCPFHNERSPSFSVSAEKGVYYCFGCGAAGNAIRFVMDLDGVSRLEALARLAERVGMTLPFLQTPTSMADAVQTRTRLEQMKAAHALTAKVYNHILMNTSVGVQALTYLESRGFSRSTIMAFELGYAPDDDDRILRYLMRKGFAPDILVEAGIAIAYEDRLLDRFRGRVMIPIRDAQGKVIAFGGRTLKPDGQPKYLNSPDTPVFHKGSILFNQHAARKEIRQAQTAILFEGYMDVVAAWQAGVRNGVASLGTSLTPEQAAMLKRFGQRLVIAYDGDEAGVKATKRALDLALEAGLSVRVVQLPDGMDPDEYIRAYGAEAFQHQLSARAMSVVEFLLRDAERSANLQNEAGRTEFVRTALRILAERATPIEQETVLRELSHTYGMSVDALKQELAWIAKGLKRRRVEPERWQQANAAMSVELPPSDVQAGNRLLQAMLTDLQSFNYVAERGVDELATPEQTALLALLYGFRAHHPDGDIQAFVDSLDDPQLVRLASSLLVLDPLEFRPDVLDDYLRTIAIRRLKDEYKQAVAASAEAQIRGDQSAVAMWRARADEVQQAIMSQNHRP